MNIDVASTYEAAAGSARRKTRRAGRRLGALIALMAGAAWAAPIPVPNGDFSDPGNDGSIGGLIGLDIVNQPIGSGPWLGSARGPLGLLLQPTLTIDSSGQEGRIQGLLGLSLLAGLLNNSGAFSQVLSETYQTGRFYVLSANIDAGGLLDLSLLGTTNVGIGLLANGTLIASSNTASPQLLSLYLLSGTTYQLRFGYYAAPGDTGPVGVQLFNEPSGLLTASLLTSTAFSNVQLEGRDIGPTSLIQVGSTSAEMQLEVGQPLGDPIIAIVQDADGNGVPGFTVTITAPLDGASADLSAPSSGDPPGRVITAVSDLDGLVVFYAHANEIAGCYRVTVEPQDPTLDVLHATFHLRNHSHDPSHDSVYCHGFQ